MEHLIATITDQDCGFSLRPVERWQEVYGSKGIILREDGKIALQYKAKRFHYKLIGAAKKQVKILSTLLLAKFTKKPAPKLTIYKILVSPMNCAATLLPFTRTSFLPLMLSRTI